MRDQSVGAVMTREVITVRPDTGVKEIVEVLVANKISAVPVIDNAGVLVGVVSEADLLPKQAFRGGVDRPRLTALRERAAWHKSQGLSAREVMTRSPVTIPPTESVPRAARRLAEVGVRRLLVVDEDGKLVGVLARRDLLKVFLRTDEQIRDDVVGEVFGEVLAADPAQISVEVTDGFVSVLGQFDRRSEVELADRLIRALLGVVGLRNELQYVFDDVTLGVPQG